MNIDLMVKIRYTVDHSDFLVNVPLSLECFPRLLPDHQSDRRIVKPSRNSRVDYKNIRPYEFKTSILKHTGKPSVIVKVLLSPFHRPYEFDNKKRWIPSSSRV